MSGIKRGTVVDAIVDAVRSSVNSGGLSPGEIVTEQRVADDFRVSRPSAKAAIERLVESGILSRTSNRPAIVAFVGSEDVEDLLATLTVLLIGATEVLIATQKRLAAVPSTHPPAALSPTDWETFAGAIVSSTGSKRLARILETLAAELRLARVDNAVSSPSQANELVAKFALALDTADKNAALDCIDKMITELRRFSLRT